MDDDWRARSSFDAFVEMHGKACWALTAGQVAVTLSNAGLSLAVGQQVQSCLPVPSSTAWIDTAAAWRPPTTASRTWRSRRRMAPTPSQIGRNQALTATVTRSTTHTSFSGCAVHFHHDVNAAAVSPARLTVTAANSGAGQPVTGVLGADGDAPYRSAEMVNGVWGTIADGSYRGGAPRRRGRSGCSAGSQETPRTSASTLSRKRRVRPRRAMCGSCPVAASCRSPARSTRGPGLRARTSATRCAGARRRAGRPIRIPARCSPGTATACSAARRAR